VRRATKRQRLLVVAVAAAVVLAVVIAVIITQTHDGGGPTPGAAAGGTHTTVSSPYDMTEASATADLKIIKDARFVSIDLKASSGKLTSYMLDASLPAMQALEAAVLKAKKVDGAVASGGSTITFVTAGRQTVTFDLDVDQGLVGRGGHAWRASGDLKALVTAATSAQT
jgi:hypothetical protein